MEPVDTATEARVRSVFDRAPFLTLLGAELVTVARGAIRIEAALHPRYTQHQGAGHAGFVTTLLDMAGALAAQTLMPADVEPVAVEFKANFLRPATGSRLIAIGRVVKPGRSLSVSEARCWSLEAGEDKPCAIFLQTSMGLPVAAV